MFSFNKNLGEAYSPLYFLAALGAGGLAITFFMYLMFMTPHPETAIPNWPSIAATFNGSNIWLSTLTLLATGGVVVFSLFHIRVLAWNIREYRLFKKTEAYQKLRSSNAEVQLMAIPLTLAMSVNVMFIAGSLFVPGIWDIIEYLFPAAIAAFAAIGIYAVTLFTQYAGRVISNGSFDCSKNNNLSQMLAIFAFSMVGVGFAASAAMSHVQITSGIAMILSLMFISVASVLAMISLILGFKGMLEQGIDKETSVSLWIMIPILTLLGIAVYRLIMGMHHNFGTETSTIGHLGLFSVIVSGQLFFALLGYVVMKKMGYFASYVKGEEKSVASYALICPGVAGTVIGFFFLHKGLIAAGILAQFSLVYLLLLIPLVLLQFKTIAVLYRLNSKMLCPVGGVAA